MKIKGDNRVVSVSGAPHEDDAQAAENDENAEDPEDIAIDDVVEETAEESAEE